MASSPTKDDKTLQPEYTTTPTQSQHEDGNIVTTNLDLLNLESVDPVLNAKMRLVNEAIDEIGFTGYQVKLFVLNGFG